MWLLIAEDSQCAERTPPWGCPTIEEYAERLVSCLGAVERFPELHINFDFSAVELEDLARRRPDIAGRLRKLVDEGRISFVNGTYSQPHTHILSLESIIRQFEYGLRTIEEITNYRVTCYASQEPGFSQMLPYILRAFGYETATTPAFPFGMSMINGSIQHWNGRWEWVHGDDMVDWLGADNTRLPVWLRNPGSPTEDTLYDDIQRGLLHPTRLKVSMPDMIEIDEEWVAQRSQYSRIVRLDQTLAEIASENPQRAAVRFEANYAYVEGVDAEELSRVNTRVESALLRLETLVAFLPVDPPDFDFDNAWRTLLAAQHHDAYWTGAPELRAKCIAQLKTLETRVNHATQEIIRGLGRKLPKVEDDTQAVMFVMPRGGPGCRTAELELSDARLTPTDAEGKPILWQKRRLDDGSTVLTVVYPDNKPGYTTLLLRPGRASFSTKRKFLNTSRLKSDPIAVSVRTDGTISSIKAGRKQLLAGPGNLWQCTINRERLNPSPVDDWGFVERGPVIETATTACRLSNIQLRTQVTLLHFDKAIQIDTDIDFPEPTEIGDYFDDTTKLQVIWNVGKNVSIRYVSGGCIEHAKPGRPFIAYPLIDIATGDASLTIKFDCATKCWLDNDGLLHCVVAWGHKGDHFHNRQGPLPGIMGPLSWLKPLDLQLKGKYHLRQILYPSASIPDESTLLNLSTRASMEPLLVPVETGGGEMPWSDTLFHTDLDRLVLLSARKADSGILLRVLNAHETPRPFRLSKRDRWQIAWARLLDGKRVAPGALPPWKVVEVLLVPG